MTTKAMQIYHLPARRRHIDTRPDLPVRPALAVLFFCSLLVAFA
jgi:hypothetical protein